MSHVRTDSPVQLVAQLRQAGRTGLVFFDATRGSASGRSFVAHSPYEILTETPDGFFAGSRPVDPFEWLEDAARHAGFLAGALAFEAAWLLDAPRVPLPDSAPRLWAAAYDHVEVFDVVDSAPVNPTVPEMGHDLRIPQEAHYCGDVERCRDAIYDGELFEINYTGRFEGRTDVSGWELFLAMRASATGGFFAYLDTGGVEIASVSPEEFVTIRDAKIVTRPIKGTRRRGATPDEDARLREELSASPKDRAENIMIVDLMRNDLARICVPGSVAVQALCELETFAGVHHLVSTVTGELANGVTPMTAFLSCFPAGSITGAPKLRAIELIAQIEGRPRGFYTGSAFCVYEGNLTSNVLIRTAEVRDGRAVYGAGGAVVADSDPRSEFEEACTKAGVFTRWFR